MKNWNKITIECKEELDKFLNNSFETSDLNFTNLFLWSFSENIEYKIENDILFIRATYQGNMYHYVPIPKDGIINNIIEPIKKIIEKNGTFLLVPEIYYEFLKNHFVLNEERDSFDYVYLQKDLATLSGRKFSSKKNKVNKFKKTYNFTYEKISQENISDVKLFQKKWMDTKENDSILASENLGINELLNNYEILNLRGGLIRINGEVVAYSIGEKLTDKIGLIHIEKGDTEYTGVYQMINLCVSAEEFSDVEFINREDDFGSMGLRVAKESYHPIKLLKKYSISNL